MVRATWHPYGPIGNSYANSPDEWLSLDHTEDLDSRWGEELWLGPALNNVDLSAVGGTTADTSGFADSGGMNATVFLYAIRGTKPAKIRISDWTVQTANLLTLGAAATDIIKTKSANATEEISIAIGDGAAYRVITAVGNFDAADTESANDESYKALKFFEAYPSNTIAALGAGTGTPSNLVAANEISGTTTMDGSAWATKVVLTSDMVFQSGVLDGIFWAVGTDRGIYVVDSQFLKFKPLIPTQGRSEWNCFTTHNSPFWGALFTTTSGVRYMRTIHDSRSIGPEFITNNTSPVQGPITGMAGDGEWDYANVYNVVTGDTYLCAFRPRVPGEPSSTGTPASWYSLRKYPTSNGSKRSNALFNLDTRGGELTNPVLVSGNGPDLSYITKGRVRRWMDDANYTFATSGTATLTELRMPSGMRGVINRVGFRAENLATTRTIQLKISVDGGTAVDVGAPLSFQTTDQWHWIDVPDRLAGHRILPSLAFVGTSGSSPRTVGDLVMEYDLEEIPQE